MKHFIRPSLLGIACALLLASVRSALAASVTLEAESGTLGGDFQTRSDGGVTYVVCTNDNTSGSSPEIPERVSGYSATFPRPGTYHLYARIRVGPGAFDDDSLFVAGDFGSPAPDSAEPGDWLRHNGLASGGHTGESDEVDGAGTAGGQVWKWVNLSRRTDGSSDAPASYRVDAGNLSRTFRIGGREDGLEIDKLVFGLAGHGFTVAELDAGGPGSPPEPPEFPPDVVAGNLIQFSENGAWCWYQDERVIYDPNTDRLITGSVASGAGTGGSARDSDVEAVIFDLGTRWPQRTLMHSYPYCDDHNAPAFLLWPDGSVVAQYAGHNNDHLSRFRTLNGDTWSPETNFDWTSAGAGSGEETSYSNPYFMSAEGRAYTFVRCIDNRSPHFLTSSDMGAAWSYGGQLVGPDGAVGYNSGYFRYSGNGIDRIDFICTEGHPRDLETSMYHGYISGGKSYRSDGTVVDEDIFDTDCPVSSDFTQIYAHGTEAPPGTIYRLWNSDVQRYEDGTIQAIIHGRIDNNTRGNDSSIDPNHAYIFCRYDGENWTSTYLCQAGTKMYGSEADYVGLGALSPNDPNTIFISTRYDPRAVVPGEPDDSPPHSLKREIWKGVTVDEGATFTWTPMTRNSTRDNLRPVVPVWDEENVAVLWFRGVYNAAQSYDAALVGLIERQKESQGEMTHVDATTGNTTLADGNPLTTGGSVGQWHLRADVGNGVGVLASADEVAENAPALKTTVPVPGPGTYDVWVNFWGDPVNGGWRIKAGPAPDRMMVFRQMACKTVDPDQSGLVARNGETRFLYQAYIGRMEVDDAGALSVYVDDHPVATGPTDTEVGEDVRTWFDGVSFAQVGGPDPSSNRAIGMLAPSAADEGNWVASWATAIETAEGNDLPPVPLKGNTLRQYVRTSIPANRIRVRFSNAYGDSPVHIRRARVALAPGVGTGEMEPGTDHGLSFGGAPGTMLLPGDDVVSDPIDFDLPALADLAISLHFGEISASRISGHRGSRTDSVIAPGDQTSTPELSSSDKVTRWYLIHAVEVLAGEEGRTVSILGDSITDGLGSTTNGNNRWPDLLAKRLAANPATEGVAVSNMGIGGNAIFGGLGPAAVERFERDVLEVSGVRYFVLFEGVNDIGFFDPESAEAGAKELIDQYRDFAIRAKARNIKAYAATITPLGGYHTAARETARQMVNDYIRNNPDFDGYIDFDAAVRDPDNPEAMRQAYSLDGLHLNPTGLQALADAVDLSLFHP